MGMFDYVDLGPHAPKCPLCGAPLTGFQTKDSPDQLMVTYRIRPDGIVEKRAFDSGYDDEPKPEFRAVSADFCGVWQIYADCTKGCKKDGDRFPSLFYVQVVIIDGRLYRVKVLDEA